MGQFINISCCCCCGHIYTGAQNRKCVGPCSDSIAKTNLKKLRLLLFSLGDGNCLWGPCGAVPVRAI